MLGSQIALAQDFKTGNKELPALPSLTVPEQAQGYRMGAPLQGQVVVAPAGTSFPIVIETPIDSKNGELGQILGVRLTAPIVVNGEEVVPAGSEAIGQITYLRKPGRMSKNAKMEVKFTKLRMPNGQMVPISGKIETIDKSGMLKGGDVKKQLKQAAVVEAGALGGGTLLGLTIGAMASEASAGAAVGVTTGGVLSLGWILTRKGKDILIPQGTNMVVTLERPLTIGR